MSPITDCACTEDDSVAVELLSSSMGSIHVVPELTITVICAVQISHGEFPEMETPKMRITVSVESPMGNKFRR